MSPRLIEVKFNKPNINISKTRILIAINILLAIAVITMSFVLFLTLSENEELSAKAQTEIERSKSYREMLVESAHENVKQSTTEKIFFQELEFYRENAVIVTKSGGNYHKYGCSHIENKDYYIYNIENADNMGYMPCNDCCLYEPILR